MTINEGKKSVKKNGISIGKFQFPFVKDLEFVLLTFFWICKPTGWNGTLEIVIVMTTWNLWIMNWCNGNNKNVIVKYFYIESYTLNLHPIFNPEGLHKK